MTYILDVKNPFGKITVSNYLEIWCSIVKIKLSILYMWQLSISVFVFFVTKIVQVFFSFIPENYAAYVHVGWAKILSSEM